MPTKAKPSRSRFAASKPKAIVRGASMKSRPWEAGPPDGGETGLGPMPRNKKKKKKEQPLDTTRDPVVPCEKVICSTL